MGRANRPRSSRASNRPGRGVRRKHEIEHVNLAAGRGEPSHAAQEIAHRTIVQVMHQRIREHAVEVLIGKDRLVGHVADHPAARMPRRRGADVLGIDVDPDVVAAREDARIGARAAADVEHAPRPLEVEVCQEWLQLRRREGRLPRLVDERQFEQTIGGAPASSPKHQESRHAPGIREVGAQRVDGRLIGRRRKSPAAG